jgi:valyl-tRNA synthetase
VEPLYQPLGVETTWQETWEREGAYDSEPEAPGDPFVIAHPPPNVTGELHMGHALQLAIADALIRWKRMQGFNVLFQTGYDHAGISTQSVVEKELEKEGLTRHDLGREAFEARVWDWLRLYGRTIMSQFRRMGASMDYRRERFTLDAGYTRAVMRFFVHLWERGWLYRANRIVNWCPYHLSALSDLELEDLEVDDTLTFVRYPLADGSGHIAVATVRPATILADVAVAVHPDDDRYCDLVGKEAVVPYVERRVPIISDERVEPEFGTGAVKITPGHDPKDFEIGRDHGLPEPMVIGADGRMNDAAGDLAGLSQAEAGECVVAWARERGLLEKQEDYRHSVKVCERCETLIEPLISLQWWCSMDELKRAALEALRARRVAYHPESQHRYAIESLENAPDWNISRQLWWGHQLPVWYCPDGHATVAESETEACAECGSRELRREDDVLDTWFSSALWPFATLGWPDDTPELRRYYPGDLNTTARDIIRLWENRMIFSGLELMGEVPFREVVIHTTILATDGRRMSKSLGTGIDPTDVIDEYGADATRYGLLKMSSKQDVRFSYEAVEEGRFLANKLWNVARLIVTNTEGVNPDARPRDVEERWILARLDATRAEFEERMPRFEFAHVANALYHLTRDEFCDWYAEAIKPRLYEHDEDAAATALVALERLLKLLHPVMPHVTEEIWKHLPAREGYLIGASWPESDPSWAESAEALDAARMAARIYRRSGVRIDVEGDARRIFENVVRPKEDGQGDVEAEVGRLRREIARAEKMLANERFVSSAPPDVVEAEQTKLAQYQAELAALGG